MPNENVKHSFLASRKGKLDFSTRKDYWYFLYSRLRHKSMPVSAWCCFTSINIRMAYTVIRLPLLQNFTGKFIYRLAVEEGTTTNVS